MSSRPWIAWICLFLIPGLTFAAEKTANDLYFVDYQFSGYVDTSYNYLLRNHKFISGIDDRVDDLTQNGFTLQAIEGTLSKLPTQGFGGLVDFLIGRNAYSNAIYGWSPYYGSQTLGAVTPDAYLQYATGPYTLIGGIFQTLLGVENFDSTLDTNFSRGILYGYAEPGSFMGVRGIYAPNDKLKLNLGLDNGWSGIRDTSRPVTVEVGGTYIFNPIVSVLVQGISGGQRLLNNIATGPISRRNMINIFATIKATQALTLIASGDYAVQNKALLPDGSIGRVVWQGLAGYMNYEWNDKWRTSFRGEVYDDQNGYTTGVRQNWRELTLTLVYAPIKHVELRAETRHDFSNVNSFMNATGPGVSNNQQSYALEALYIF